jgi:hypothetical protein
MRKPSKKGGDFGSFARGKYTRRAATAANVVVLDPQARKTKANPFRGRWRIASTSVWESAALNEFGPAYLTFGAGRRGELDFIAISASVDYRIGTRDGSSIVEFTWAGDDDGSPISGRGWARRVGPGLVGRFFIHDGDDAKFVAERFAKTEKRPHLPAELPRVKPNEH